jgi:hypothetical protein
VAAALTAAALSGAVGLVGELAPAPVHRCACSARKGPDHRCACPECARLALRTAEDRAADAVPPCHRAATVADREAARRREDERSAREAGRCGLREDCGRSEDEAALGERSLGCFSLPATAASWVAARRTTVLPQAAPVALLDPEPELPPPRA